MLDNFRRAGKASFLLGGQWGSEGKGAAAAFLATHLRERHESFDIVTTNAGAQAGHTSTHDGQTKVVFHLPTAALYPDQPWPQPLTFLNAGSIIDPEGLLRELAANEHVLRNFAIHPNAAIITQECRDYEMRDDSAQTKIASTRKGVGEALARKVLRSGMTAKDYPVLCDYVHRVDLADAMSRGLSVLVEVPQGHSLSIDGPFYPHTTSRNCTVMQAMSDAGIHPHYYHQSMLVVRTYPIRVGHIETPGQVYHSGDCFPDQRELSWEQLGQKPEITTVTKRVRRVFTFSEQQVIAAIAQTKPNVIYLTFCDYLPADAGDKKPAARDMVQTLRRLSMAYGAPRPPEILTQWGPTTKDVIRGEDL